MALKDFSIYGFKPFAQGQPAPPLGEKGVVDAFGSSLFSGSGGVEAYNPSELVSRKGLEIFDRMRIDEQIKASMAFKQNTVVAAGWDIQSPEGKDEDWEQAIFIRDMFNNLGAAQTIQSSRKGLSDAIIEILSAMEYGYSITEEIFAEVDGKIVLQDLKTRSPHNWTFKVDAHGNVKAVLQHNQEMPTQKFLIYSYDAEFQNPYGRSDLESAYRPWWIKNNAYKWLAMLLEKHGIPPIFALYNPAGMDSPAQSALQTVMKNLQAATVGMIPRGKKDDLDMWSPDLASNVQDVFLPAIDKFDQAISKAILVPALLGMTSDESEGSYARSKTHFDVFMLIVEKIRGDMERLVQDELVKVLIDLNYGGDEYPIFKFNPISESINEQLLEQWGNLVEGGVVHKQADDEKHIRKLLGLPPMDEASVDSWEDGGPEPTGGEPKKDDGEGEDLDAELSAHFALARVPNQYEKKVNFVLVAKDLNQFEVIAVENLAESMTVIRDKFIKYTVNQFEPTPVWVRGVTLRGMQDWTNQLEQSMRVNYEYGRERITAELPKAFSETGPAFLNSQALSEIKTRALDNSTTVKGRIVADVKNTLLQGISLGMTATELIPQIEQAFLPYIGDPTVLKNGEPLSKYLIENIVRTESSMAFNRGRLIQMRSPEAAPFVQAVEYSAILDSRTTPVCRLLDGKVFQLNSDALTDLAPPNHYQCRSIIVPITIDETIEQTDLVTPAQIGRGQELANKGFVL